jgi:hypothetical protein
LIDYIRTIYSLYATFIFVVFLLSALTRTEDSAWQDSMFALFQHPAPFPIKEVSFRLMFVLRYIVFF